MNGLENLTGALTIPKIKNGSKVSAGKLYGMNKWCFGLTVEDYTEE